MEREFCGVCVARNPESYQEARVEFWQGLTESLGLPKWVELHRIKEVLKSK
jgi:hypothetical protein